MLLLLLLLGSGQGPRQVGAGQTFEYLKREHSLSKPYQGVGTSSSSLWNLMGNAMVMTQYIRLTPDMQSKQGALWNRVPCFLRDWELQVHFRIHGQGKKNLHGDGLAIWYTKDRMQPDNHDVISLKLFELTVERTPEEEKLHRDVFLPSVDNMKLPEMTAPLPPLSGLALFLIVFFSLVFSVFAIVIGIILYNKWQDQSRKRFY